ncbi:MAG: hypothetical protein ACLTSG_14305 [Lachnospiraceae bacterium]
MGVTRRHRRRQPISSVQSRHRLYNSLRDKFRDRDTGLWLFCLC